MSDLLTPNELAAMLGMSVRTLANWRSTGKGPPYLKIGVEPPEDIRTGAKSDTNAPWPNGGLRRTNTGGRWRDEKTACPSRHAVYKQSDRHKRRESTLR